MKKLILLSISTAALMTMGSSCSDTEEAQQEEVQPRVTQQIDRMGRAAINTAITDPFFADAAAHGELQDEYNSNDDPSTWNGDFGAQFRGNMAILDALDGVAGNQLAASMVEGSRYNTLSGVLTDDRLYVNTNGLTCTTYLAVEANATMILENEDCGGRAPFYDTVDVSYSVLANGSFGDVGDGVADPMETLPDFPFLAAPITTMSVTIEEPGPM